MGNVEAALSRTIDRLMDSVQALREQNSELRQKLFWASQEIGRLQHLVESQCKATKEESNV